jgi:hypothetical protein
MAVDCEAFIGDGRTCGVGAIGRCRVCGQAYCLSHRAITIGNYLPYTDYCLACQTRASEQERQAKQETAQRAMAETEQKREAIKRLTELLLSSGRASFEPRRKFVGTRTNHANPFRAFFGQAYVMVFEDLEPAIPIGMLPWEFPPVPRGDSNQTLDRSSGVTRSGAIVQMNFGAPGEEFVSDRSFGVRASDKQILDCLKETLHQIGVTYEQ